MGSIQISESDEAEVDGKAVEKTTLSGPDFLAISHSREATSSRQTSYLDLRRLSSTTACTEGLTALSVR